MKKVLVLVVLMSFFPSCKKSSDEISVLDYVSKTKYYQTEIFNSRNQILYGKWHFNYSSGSIAGGTFDPTYDYLEIVKFGIYGIIKNDSIRQFGRIIINTQDSIETKISFYDENNFCLTSYQPIQRTVTFQGNDTLILWDGMIDGYFNYYNRVK
jgi:hypothetical protein